MVKHFMSDELRAYYDKLAYNEPILLQQLRQETAGLPRAQMQVTPEQGQYLQLMVKLLAAKNIIEVGVFTGYSSLAMASALPDDGLLIACDCDEQYTAIAQRYWQQAGIADKIKLKLAPAVETLDALLARKQACFDLAFIDANKNDYDRYYEQCLALLRTGGCLILDNMLSAGKFLASNDEDQSPMALTIRKLNQKIHDDKRVDFCLLPLGTGMTVVRKR